jgi:hypothetical protein
VRVRLLHKLQHKPQSCAAELHLRCNHRLMPQPPNQMRGIVKLLPNLHILQ